MKQEQDLRRYWAFISYSSKDVAVAKRLHQRLETFPVPSRYRGRAGRDGEGIPRRLFPIFRDRDEFPLSADLGASIEDALRASRYLIVICSPDAARSKWVDAEVAYFKSLGREDRIFAVITRGTPNASDQTATQDQECFPPSLRYRFQGTKQTLNRVEPIAGDLRSGGDGWPAVVLKSVAGITGIAFGQLQARERRRLFAQRAMIGVVTLCVAMLMLVLGSWAIFNRREATSANLKRTDSERVAAAAHRRTASIEYVERMGDIEKHWRRAELEQARTLLQEYVSSHGDKFEWRYWKHLLSEDGSVTLPKLDDDIVGLEFDAVGEKLACVTGKGQVVVFRAADGKELSRFGEDIQAIVSAYGGWVTSSWEPGSDIGDWDLDGQPRFARSLGRPTLVTAMAYDPYASQMAFGQADAIHVTNPWGTPISATGRTQSDLLFRGPPDLRALYQRGLNEYSLDVMHGMVFCAAFNENGSRLAVGYEDGTAQVWNVRGKVGIVATMNDQGSQASGAACGIAISSDGNRVALQTEGRDGERGRTRLSAELSVWNVGNESKIWKATDAESIAWNIVPPDERGLIRTTVGPKFSKDGKQLVSIVERAVNFWDAEGGTQRARWNGPGGIVRGMAYHEAASRLAIVDTQGRVVIRSLQGTIPLQTVYRTAQPLYGLTISSNANRAAVSALASDRMRLPSGRMGWDVAVRTFEISNSDDTQQSTEPLAPSRIFHSPLFLNNKQAFAVVDPWYRDEDNENQRDGEVYLVRGIQAHDGSYQLVEQENNDHIGLALVTSSGTTTKLYESGVSTAAISPSGELFAIGTDEGVVDVYSRVGIQRFSVPLASAAISAFDFGPDGKLLAVGDVRGGCILLNLETGKIVARLVGHQTDISCLRFSADGTRLFSSSGANHLESAQTGEIFAWDIETNQSVLQLRASMPARYPGLALDESGHCLFALATEVISESEIGDSVVLQWDLRNSK